MYLKQQVTFNRFGCTRHTRLSVSSGEWFKAISIDAPYETFSWKNLPRVIWSPPQLSRIIWRGSFRRGRNLRTDLKRSWRAENANDLFAEIANGYLQRSHRNDRVLSRWRSATPCFPLAIANISASVFRVVNSGHSPIFTGPTPGIYSGSFVPQEPPRHSRQPRAAGRSFFSLSCTPRIVPSRRSQVLTKNE